MAFSGSIETISLSGILQLLCNENKTGILRVKQEGTEYQIYFLDGNILYAIQSLKQARLGQLLVEDGILPREVIRQCLKDASKEKVALGKILVDQGHITFETLEQFIYRQILEIFCHIFEWETGDFVYDDIQYNLRWLVIIKLNTLQLVMEALRRIDETDAVERMR